MSDSRLKTSIEVVALLLGIALAGVPSVAMAYLDRAHRTPGTRLALAVGDRELEAEVVLLPFYQGGDERRRAAGLYERAVSR